MRTQILRSPRASTCVSSVPVTGASVTASITIITGALIASFSGTWLSTIADMSSAPDEPQPAMAGLRAPPEPHGLTAFSPVCVVKRFRQARAPLSASVKLGGEGETKEAELGGPDSHVADARVDVSATLSAQPSESAIGRPDCQVPLAHNDVGATRSVQSGDAPLMKEGGSATSSVRPGGACPSLPCVPVFVCLRKEVHLLRFETPKSRIGTLMSMHLGIRHLEYLCGMTCVLPLLCKAVIPFREAGKVQRLEPFAPMLHRVWRAGGPLAL